MAATLPYIWAVVGYIDAVPYLLRKREHLTAPMIVNVSNKLLALFEYMRAVVGDKSVYR